MPVRCRIDTADEVEYYKHGGILQYVLRGMAKAAQAAFGCIAACDGGALRRHRPPRTLSRSSQPGSFRPPVSSQRIPGSEAADRHRP